MAGPRMTGEEWIEIVDHPDYLISTHGRVFSVRTRKFLSPYLDRMGKQSPYAGGVWKVTVSYGNRTTTLNLAREMLKAFRPPPQQDDVAPHWRDGNRANCRLDNLEWRPRPRPFDREHLTAIAKMGYAASPVAQAQTGRPFPKKRST